MTRQWRRGAGVGSLAARVVTGSTLVTFSRATVSLVPTRVSRQPEGAWRVAAMMHRRASVQDCWARVELKC